MSTQVKVEDAVRIETSPRWVRAYFANVAIADSKRVLLVWEGARRVPTYYFPVQDVRMDLLKVADAASAGDKTRYDLRVGSRAVETSPGRMPGVRGSRTT
jgi:uncharacterized protein (DUF427 family)